MNKHSALQAAEEAIERGWCPLPLPNGSKKPNVRDWTNLRYSSVSEVREAFSHEDNIGLILGKPSGGLVDIDLDTVEARMLADAFLPHTGMTHGREGSPSSHRWYVVDKELATKRFQDRSDSGATLVEIRSTGGQTVIPPSTHPSGEVLEWGEDALRPSQVRRVVLKRSAALLASAALLTRHWPDQGARHDAVMALAGGLLRSGWKPGATWNFLLEIGRAAGDEEASHRKGDVSTTVRRIKAGKPVQGWPSLARLLGQEVVDDVRDWLQIKADDVSEEGEDAETPLDEVRNKRDLGHAIRNGVPEPEWVIEKLLYAGKIHWMTGDPGSGKTLIMLKFGLDVVAAGGHVLHVDEEAGLEMTSDRLARMGADPDTLTERYHYHEFPGISDDDDDLERLFREVAKFRPRLVVFDSASDLLEQAGINEDENIPVTSWIKRVIEPLAHEYGAAVVVIDHTTKSREQGGKWARGAGAKKAKSKAMWHVEKVQEFSIDPPTMGLVRLKQTKDTLGRLPARHDLRIGAKPDGRTLIETALVVSPSNAPLEMEDATLDKRIVAYLSAVAALEEDALTPKQIADELKVKTSKVRTVIDELVDDGDLLTAETGAGYLSVYVSMAQVLDFSLDT